MAWCRKGLASLEAGVVRGQEVADVFGIEATLDTSQGVGAGDLLTASEDAAPYATMPLDLLQRIETPQACEKHDEERQGDGTSRDAGTRPGVDKAPQPREEAQGFLGVGQDPPEDLAS